MRERVAIVGVGYTPFRPLSPEVSFREMIYEAAVRAYQDAGIEPRDVDTFVSLSEDYLEGTAIADEYVPDQLGAVLKPVHTIAADGITGIASALLQLETGRLDIAVVEGRSKASNILYPAHIEAFALDPIFVRPLGFHPRFVAGMEMRAFLEATGNTEGQTARVVEKNRRNALRNPLAAYPAHISAGEVLSTSPVAEPLKEGEVARYADGAIVLVLARESVARRLKGMPVFIRGIGWAQHTPNLEGREWHRAIYAELAGEMAYRMAGIRSPSREIDFAELDDTFAYKELQHLEALRLARPGESGQLLEEGAFHPDGQLPVNASGGNLGCGYTYDLSGLRSVLEVVLQLRGAAGERQLKGVRVGLAQSWRGIPTASGAVIILANE
jgi:acetyl-CoA C-acetyltransferase